MCSPFRRVDWKLAATQQSFSRIPLSFRRTYRLAEIDGSRIRIRFRNPVMWLCTSVPAFPCQAVEPNPLRRSGHRWHSLPVTGGCEPRTVFIEFEISGGLEKSRAVEHCLNGCRMFSGLQRLHERRRMETVPWAITSWSDNNICSDHPKSTSGMPRISIEGPVVVQSTGGDHPCLCWNRWRRIQPQPSRPLNPIANVFWRWSCVR